MKLLLIAAMSACVAFGGNDETQETAKRTKIIGHGWDMLASTPAEILANADLFDKSGLDGVSVVLVGKRTNGKGAYDMRSISLASPWTREMLEPHMPALKEFRNHRGLRESLVMCMWAPKTRI